MRIRAYFWDEVECKVRYRTVDLPAGVSCRDGLILADAAISASIGDSFGSHNRRFSNVAGVSVMRAVFGSRDMKCRVYLCPESWERARDLAQKELDAEFDEPEEPGLMAFILTSSLLMREKQVRYCDADAAFGESDGVADYGGELRVSRDCRYIGTFWAKDRTEAARYVNDYLGIPAKPRR